MTLGATEAARALGMSQVDRDAHEALLQFLYMAPIGLVQIGIDGRVELMNPMSASILLSLSPRSSLENLFDALQHVAPELRDLAKGFGSDHGCVCTPLRVAAPRSTDSAARERTVSITLFKLDQSRIMAMLQDVSVDVERETVDRKATAHIDPLTAMPNRAAVLDYIREGLSMSPAGRDRHCAVLFLDVDRFKLINDSLGYAAGDQVLTLLASRLVATLRRVSRASGGRSREPLAARLGGDEFAVVLDDLSDSEEVHVVADRLTAVLAQPFGIGDHVLQCTVSIGMVLRPQFEGDADGVLRDAGIAMREAKRAGGGRRVVFQPRMRDRATHRQDIEEQLRVALVERQLFVVYQPVIGFGLTSSGHRMVDRTAGVEALVRWRHPQRGIIPPLEFIGIAEECGLIGTLGQFVLEEACRQFMLWRATLGDNAPRTLAVNLSRGQIDVPGFVSEVEDVLIRCGMDATALQLEITESLAAQDESVQTRLHELKALGVTLALDDFGTGFSSLSSLHLLPVDTVKIDRSFVNEAVESTHHRALIEATVRVAASLGMRTVAEGIETEAQSSLIRALGCDKGQGYFFSRPLEALQLGAWATTVFPTGLGS